MSDVVWFGSKIFSCSGSFLVAFGSSWSVGSISFSGGGGGLLSCMDVLYCTTEAGPSQLWISEQFLPVVSPSDCIYIFIFVIYLPTYLPTTKICFFILLVIFCYASAACCMVIYLFIHNFNNFLFFITICFCFWCST